MYWWVQTSPRSFSAAHSSPPPRVVGVQDGLVRRECQAVGRFQVGDHGRHRAIGRDAMDAVEVDLPLLRWQTQAGVGEVDASVGAAHHVVGAVQPLALPAVGDDGDRPVGFPAGHLPVVPVAHDDPALQVESQPVCAAAVLPYHLGLAAGHQAIDDVDAVVHEQQVAVRMPQRPFGKREPGGQALCLVGFNDVIQAIRHDPLLISLCRLGVFNGQVAICGSTDARRAPARSKRL